MSDEREADSFERSRIEKETITNDAVAGETVLEGPGSGNAGATGGSPKEFEPDLPENELTGEPIDLDEDPPERGANGS